MADNKLDIKAFLDKDEQKDLLRLLTAGSVDDGKINVDRTLVVLTVRNCMRISWMHWSVIETWENAGEHTDYALLLDGLKAEREQGITIDVAYRYFSTNGRKFIIADTPDRIVYP